MYKETRETVLTILLTALIVGGGMYWFYNSDMADDVSVDIENETVSEENESAENEIGLPELNEGEISSVEKVIVGDENNASTELETARVFEPKNYTNKEGKYSIDFPKDWYWHHYWSQPGPYTDEIGNNFGGGDLLAFDTQSLPDTLQGEYVGKIVIYANPTMDPISANEQQIAEMKKWYNYVTLRTIVKDGPDITVVRGEMPEDGLSMGSTNVRISAFIIKDNFAYTIGIAGPTPEEEKIFEQMVASFRFEE